MNKRFGKKNILVWISLVLTLVFAQVSMASQDDNSLYSLGITTEGVTVEPEFTYSTWEYTVTVPGGTRELELDPVPSADAARIADVTGTTLQEDGTGTVLITVEAGDGSQFTYTLHVVSDGTVPAETETEKQTEKETEKQTEAQTEPETEDTRYVRVDRNTIEEAENTITSLKNEITEYRNTINLYTRIMFGLIALAVVLLFIVINLLIRRKDLKAELNDYRSLGYSESKSAQKARKKAQKEAGVTAAESAAAEAASRKAQKRAKNMPAYEQPSQAYVPAGMHGQYDTEAQQTQSEMQQFRQQMQAAQQQTQVELQQMRQQAQAAMQQQNQMDPEQLRQRAQQRAGQTAAQVQQQAGQAAAQVQQQAGQAAAQVQQQTAQAAVQMQQQVDQAAAQAQQQATEQVRQASQQAQEAKKEIQINMIDL